MPAFKAMSGLSLCKAIIGRSPAFGGALRDVPTSNVVSIALDISVNGEKRPAGYPAGRVVVINLGRIV